MTRHTPIALVLMLVPSFARADDPVPPALLEGGMQPMIGTVEGVKDGQLIFRHTIMVPEPRKVTLPQKESAKGKEPARQVEMSAMRALAQRVEYPLGEVKAFDLDGKPLDPKGLSKRFTRPSLCLYQYEGVSVDPAFLQIARPGVIFIVLPGLPRPVVPPVQPGSTGVKPVLPSEEAPQP